MSLARVFVWPVAAASYMAVALAAVHWVTGSWSGVASLGLWFAVFVGVPSVVGYAGSIWWRRRAQGIEKVEVAVGLALPVLLLALAGLVLLFGML